MDTYCLYLRPQVPHGDVADRANACQQRWGGLHATLCSFAPKAISRCKGAHGGSLIRAMEAMHKAAKASEPSEPPISHETSHHQARDQDSRAVNVSLGLDPLEALPEVYPRSRVVILRLPGSSQVLRAISAVAADKELVNARRPEELHITLGPRRQFPPRDVEAMRSTLRACTRWRLVIVKCKAGEKELCVSEDREELALEWAFLPECLRHTQKCYHHF